MTRYNTYLLFLGLVFLAFIAESGSAARGGWRGAFRPGKTRPLNPDSKVIENLVSIKLDTDNLSQYVLNDSVLLRPHFCLLTPNRFWIFLRCSGQHLYCAKWTWS
jgi:hypothetical protein